jgi:hypothetical protein
MRIKSNNGGAMQNVPVFEPSSDDEADAAIWPTVHRVERVALGTCHQYRNSDDSFYHSSRPVPSL